MIQKDTFLSKETIHLQLADESKAGRREALEEYLKKNTIPIGKPIANTQIYILDKYGNLLPPGVKGELYVGGDGLAKGYLHQPELTQQKFIPNPFTEDNKNSNKTEEERLYRTGDLARWLPDGHIEFLGRIDNQVKIRGFRIELGEIEAVLNTHPQIQQAVVVATGDISENQRLVAYVAPSDQSPGNQQLQEFLKQKLPEYMVPSTFVALDTLPLTPNGKVDRRSLPAAGLARPELEKPLVKPRSPIEEVLAAIWLDVLQVEIGIYDNFFELGGHSLLATQVVSRVRQAFSIDLPLRSLFESPTIAQLSALVELAIQGEDNQSIKPPIKSVSREQNLPLSFAQQRLWFRERK